MPLKSGSSRKTISANISRLRKEEGFDFRNLLAEMFDCVAIRAKDFDVFWIVVPAIAVLVVWLQDFWMRVIPTAVTAREQTAKLHPCVKVSSVQRCRGALEYSCAFFTTKRVIGLRSRGWAQKLLSAYYTGKLNRANSSHCTVITLARTILSGLFAEINHAKFISANCACDLNTIVLVVVLPKTFAGAVMKFLPTMFWDSNLLSALYTAHHFGGDAYAS